MRWRISHLKERLRRLLEEDVRIKDEIEKVETELEHFEDMAADAEIANFAEYATEER